MTGSLNDFTQLFPYIFKDIDLLTQALTHRSYAFEYNNGTGDNERLEFLGDSIIGACVSEGLYKLHPDLTEGRLTLIKSYLVSKKFLAELGIELNIGNFIRLGTGEEKTGGRSRITLIGNAFEALTGAIFLDSGYKEAYDFIWSLINPKMDYVYKNITAYNFKNILQVYIQKEYGKLPKYHIKSVDGPQHQKIYTVIVSLDEMVLGEGIGPSKKKAGSQAAHEALINFNIL